MLRCLEAGVGAGRVRRAAVSTRRLGAEVAPGDRAGCQWAEVDPYATSGGQLEKDAHAGRARFRVCGGQQTADSRAEAKARAIAVLEGNRVRRGA